MTTLMIKTQSNNIVGITSTLFFSPADGRLKTLKANQNWFCFKELKDLKRPMANTLTDKQNIILSQNGIIIP